MSPERKLATDLLADAIRILRDPPQAIPGSKLWKQWLHEREREIEFFENPRKSAFWCEAAGLDWDAVVSRLRAQGLLEQRKSA